MNKTISMVVAVMILALGHQGLSAATNLVSNVLVVTNQCKTIVTYTMETNGTAHVNDPTGRLIGTAEEAALRVAAEGQGAIASAAQVAAESARWEWDAFIATNDTHIVYIDAGFEQDLPALATNFCGWVASSFYDRERSEDHYYVWFNREIDYPPSMAARIVSESGTNWLYGAWKDWNVTNWIDKATGKPWTRPYDAEVEWLEGTGTQLVSTRLSVRSSLACDATYVRMTTMQAALFGGSDGSNNNAMKYYATPSSNDNAWRFNSTSMVGPFDNYKAVNTVHTDKTGITLNNVKYDMPVSDFTSDTPVYLFGVVTRGYFQYFFGRVMSFRVKDGRTLILDLTPVRFTNENGVSEGAMFDRVSGQLFRNSGTGAFIIGPDTNTPIPCHELVVPRRNDMCVLKTGTTITLGGKDGFNADVHNVNIEVGGTPTATTAVSAPFYAVTIDGTNRVVTAFTNGFINVENGFIKEPTVDPSPQPPLPPIEWSGLAFTFEEAGTELKLMKNSSSAQAITLQISTDGGETWSEWAETNGDSSRYPFRSFVSTSAGQKICLRGDNETISTAWNRHYYFSMNGRISASGNIQSIVGFSEDVAPFCYYNLFVDCASLVTAPELPATTLADSCYDGMFSGCSSLVTAPALPATTLAYACYDYMFYGCASLVTAPELPATTLAGYCYAYMFFDCTSLASITMLATNVDAGGCLDRWVEGVAPTGTFTKAEGMTTLPTGRSGIPEGWEVRSFERQ